MIDDVPAEARMLYHADVDAIIFTFTSGVSMVVWDIMKRSL
jgi:hypothetical protein